MDYKNPDFWIAMAVGGSLIAILSTIQQFTKKNQEDGIRYRAIFRDFFIGAFLSTIVYMFIPDSVSQFLSFGSSTLSKVSSSMSGGSSPASLHEIEIQTGPARF
jgi:hypothetical protein